MFLHFDVNKWQYLSPSCQSLGHGPVRPGFLDFLIHGSANVLLVILSILSTWWIHLVLHLEIFSNTDSVLITLIHLIYFMAHPSVHVLCRSSHKLQFWSFRLISCPVFSLMDIYKCRHSWNVWVVCTCMCFWSLMS
jgi:hypothetical protein